MVLSSSMQDTPTDLLAHLLHHVGQGDRLSSCALVEKRWRQAAMMATKSIACTATSGPALQNLSAWLDSNIHATRIKEIQVEDKASIYFWVRPAVQLPIWKLTQLEVLQLISCNLMVTSAQPSGLVTTPAASSQSGSLSALTALSRLVLKDTLLDLSTIGSLVTLQHLSLCRVGHVEEECLAITTAASEGEQQEIPYNEVYDSSSIWLPQLAQLTRLTYLAVEYSPFELPRQPAASAITACLSSLQGLQRLELNISGLEAADLAHLPTCLTALSLSELPEISVKVLPCMQQLTHLQSLQLVNSKQVDPVVLSNLVQLTDLRITSSRLLDATAKQSLEHGLMAALQHMTQMQHLELSSSLLEVTRQPDLYAALTASTELRHLNLIDCKLLAGASKYIFPATGSHPALQVVIIGADLLSSHGDFGRLVCCCPSLRHLEVVSEPWADAYAVQVPYQGLSALTRLSSLTRLVFNNVTLDNEDLQGIAACSQLRELAFDIEPYPATPVTGAGIMQLTQLIRLTQLALNDEMKPGMAGLLTDQDKEGRRRRPNRRLQLQQAITSVKAAVLARAQA